MKTNFQKNKIVEHPKESLTPKNGDKKDYTQSEFEEFIIKSGAVGSYMIFRSEDEEEEMGISEL
jgi:hypothetical protein